MGQKMKMPERLERACRILYNAYHTGELNAFDCEACAAGNLCNGLSVWSLSNLKAQHDTEKISLYPHSVIITVESIFMEPFYMDPLYGRFPHQRDRRIIAAKKELQFEGLSKVISYLCAVDGYPDIMEMGKNMFDSVDEKPKYELSEIIF